LTHYKYQCRNRSGVRLKGNFSSEQTDRDYVVDNVLFAVAKTAGTMGLPWDPFNLTLIVEAQPEPKHEHLA
jgi:hypothetical protein